jgi:hypothetical protein
MIPTFEVKIEVRVDMTRVCSPPWHIIHQTNGLLDNHFYEYLGQIKWKDFEFILQLENRALKLIDSQTKDPNQFDTNIDKLLENPEWEEELNELRGLDLGIASAVFALYAFGCFPITSCRGHLSLGHEKYPLVVFFARPERVPVIVGIAAGTSVGLCNEECEGGEALMVYANNIIDMQRFALGLHKAFLSITLTERKRRQLQQSTVAPAPTASTQKNVEPSLKEWIS